MKENLKDKRTSIPGYILMTVALVLFVADHLVEMKKEPNGWVLLGMFIAGAMLLAAPKKFADAIEKAANGLLQKFLPSK